MLAISVACSERIWVATVASSVAMVLWSSRATCHASMTPSEAPWSYVQKTQQQILKGIGKDCNELSEISCGDILLALDAFENKRYDEAAKENEVLIGHMPLVSELHFNLAECYYHLGRYGDAISAYREAVRLGPSDGYALCNLGEVLWKLGRLDEAKEELSRAIETTPGLALAHYNLGVVLKERGELEEATEEYREAIAIEPGLAFAHHNLGVVLQMKGLTAEALAEFCTAAVLDPTDTLAQMALRGTIRDLPGLEVAGRILDNLNKEYSDMSSQYYVLGQESFLREDNVAAEAALRKAVKIKPDFSAAYCDLGVVLNKLRRSDEAADAYRMAIVIDPGDRLPYHNLLSLLAERDDLDSAIVAASAAVKAFPDDAQFRISLGELLAITGRFEEANVEFREVLCLEPESELAKKDLSLSLFSLGNLHRNAERYSDAESCYKEVISIRPDCLEATFNLGNTLASMQRLDEALELWGKALRLQPDLQRAVDNITAVLIQRGNSEIQVRVFLDSVRAVR